MVQHQCPAQLPAVEEPFQLHVFGVAPPHEAHLDTPVPEPLLRRQDAQGGSRVGGERLLAQHRQVTAEGLEQGRLVGGSRGSDEDGVHVLRCHGRRRFGVRRAALDGVRERLRPFRLDVDDGCHACPADDVVESAHMIRAHLAGADDGNTQCSPR